MISDDMLTIDELRLLTVWFWPISVGNQDSLDNFRRFQRNKDVMSFWKLPRSIPSFQACGIDLRGSLATRILRDLNANFQSMSVNRLDGICLVSFSPEDEAMLKLMFAP